MPKNKSLSIINPPEGIKEGKTISDKRKENSDADKILRAIRTLIESHNTGYCNPTKNI